ncbi:MAG: hypothetical protein HY931_02685 [Candidatus Falkowbacteria bacterium]|nr:MAG: hypothetical protein HY931_02685 [Candidatus Falkowbacteria bacterium]
MATSDDRSNSGTGFDSNFDSRLMGKDGDSDSAAKAGALNEAKRNGDNPENGQASEPQTLREAVIAEKRKQAAEEAKAGGGLKQKAAAPMRKGTSKLLQSAWEYLIPSWGLTLIWINIHVFLSLVIGRDVFCRLGDEWLDAMPGGGGAAQKAALGEASQKISGCANMGESMVLVGLDLLLLIVIIAIVAVIALLVKFVEDPVGFYASEFKLIWGVIKGAIVN